jgi:hypothetical protein
MIVRDTFLSLLMRHAQKYGPLFVFTAFLMMMSGAGFSQFRVEAGFLDDSIKIGEQTAFYLSAKYPSDATVLFPDSVFGFAPFEYQKRKYFPTETTGGVSTDSTIYYLTTFEVGRIQILKLPAFVVSPQDCTVYYSNEDSIRIVQLVKTMPDSIAIDKLPLKETISYHPVALQFNFFVMSIVVGALLIVAVVVWLFFGKRIARYFAARRLQRKHSQFTGDFNSIVAELQGRFSRTGAESALSIWKKYMEELEARPYTKLTSRETFGLLRDERLRTNLMAIDRAIYGHESMIVEPLQHLRVVADQHFSKKLEEVKYAK